MLYSIAMAKPYPTIIPGLRSPAEQVNGLVYFGRMLDKMRLAAAGKEESLYLTSDHFEIVDQYLPVPGIPSPEGFDPPLQPDGSVQPEGAEPPPEAPPPEVSPK